MRTQKADRLKAARRLLADGTGMVEAAMALSIEFSLSRRQTYRYLELARVGRPAQPVAENSITITLKMPESLAAIFGLMPASTASRQARSSGGRWRHSWP
jgi:hypothetical protein